MSETLLQISSIAAESKYLISGLTILCAVTFFQMTESRVLTAIFVPIAALGAVLGILISRELGIYYSPEQNSNVLIASILGLFVAIGVVVGLTRLTHIFVNAISRWQLDRLKKRRS